MQTTAEPADRPHDKPASDASAAGGVAAGAPWEADGLRLYVLGSGSQGNCSVIACPEGLVLVDAGLSCRQTFERMGRLGLDPADVRAVLVTHEHADHIGGLRVTAKRLGVPVYASEGTSSSDSWRKALTVCAETLVARRPFSVCGIRVTPFRVPHDAAETIGFRFERAGDAIGLCTDLGRVTEEAGEHLRDARILAIESNHDPEMLRGYEGYPAHLKARIAGGSGHLSNEQASDAIPRLATSRTETVVGMHISQHTNLPSTCRDALLRGEEACGRRDLRTVVASQVTPLAIL